jgi:mannitol-1-phosphate 5-dehydrogenase
MKLVQIGAGNIGRSFIGQLFARAEWQVVFLDIDSNLVRALNEKRGYRIIIKDEPAAEILIQGVAAVDARDEEAAAREIASADLVSSAVGAAALPGVYSLIAKGLLLRQKDRGPLDILICENVLRGAELFRSGLKSYLPAGYPLGQTVGLVETSIGKMVPIMPEEVRRNDPLLLYAEAFNTLIVDRKGFIGPVPDVPGVDAKDNIEAYVDRKLFIHNLGHAVAAYVGHAVHPELPVLWQALDDARVREVAERAMWESGRALIRRYPGEFSEENQAEHIRDLLRRFANRALGDTVHRVGRDLPRKLGPEERLVGGIRLQQQEGAPSTHTTLGLACALLFRAPDESGRTHAADEAFAERLRRDGAEAVLHDVCGLDAAKASDAEVIANAATAFRFLAANPEPAWLDRFLQAGFSAFSGGRS